MHTVCLQTVQRSLPNLSNGSLLNKEKKRVRHYTGPNHTYRLRE